MASREWSVVNGGFFAEARPKYGHRQNHLRWKLRAEIIYLSSFCASYTFLRLRSFGVLYGKFLDNDIDP